MKTQGMKCLSLGEAKQLIVFLADRRSYATEYFMINLVLNTGLRIAEVHRLTVGDVANQKKLKVKGKGQKIRYVPLNAEIRRHTEEYLDWKRKHAENIESDSPLFMSRNDNRLSIRAIQRRFAKVLKEAGLSDYYTFHSLRHTFATETYKADRNIRTVQVLLGHSYLNTTMRYTNVNDEDKEKAVNALATTYKS